MAGTPELLKRALRALGNHTVDEAVLKVRAIIGPQEIPPSEPLAQAALEKLHLGEVPSSEELIALEIVIRLLRPVVFSRDCELGDLPDSDGERVYPQELRDQWSDFRERVKPVVCSIGRIEAATGQHKHKGTGFLVADGLLATNRHVLSALTYGAEALATGAARVIFKQEAGLPNAPKDVVPIEGVASIHPTLDLVLLRVTAPGRQPLQFTSDPTGEGDPIVTIGYPIEDLRNNPLFLAGVFQGVYGVKRAAVGEVLDGNEAPSFYHDCSTTQGNSGSPVLSLKSARVVGIHRAGFFMYRNEAIDADALEKFVSVAA